MNEEMSRRIREVLQAAVDEEDHEMPTAQGGEMASDGLVVTWVVVVEVARPGGESWAWLTSGDASDAAGRTAPWREEGLLRFAQRRVDAAYEEEGE